MFFDYFLYTWVWSASREIKGNDEGCYDLQHNWTTFSIRLASFSWFFCGSSITWPTSIWLHSHFELTGRHTVSMIFFLVSRTFRPNYFVLSTTVHAMVEALYITFLVTNVSKCFVMLFVIFRYIPESNNKYAQREFCEICFSVLSFFFRFSSFSETLRLRFKKIVEPRWR